jgi:tetratricopeptide (TPR) repeat protein
MSSATNQTATIFCTACGSRVEAGWAFCRACGVALAPAAEPAPAEAADPVGRAVVVAAENLVQAGHVMEAKATLDDALHETPDSYVIHFERASLLGRLGLFPQAIDDLATARRLLPPDDVRELLRCQELDRWLREKSKNSFVHQAALPRIPGWLPGIGRSRGQGPRR